MARAELIANGAFTKQQNPARSPRRNRRALKDGPGLQATALSAERCFLHLQEN